MRWAGYERRKWAQARSYQHFVADVYASNGKMTRWKETGRTLLIEHSAGGDEPIERKDGAPSKQAIEMNKLPNEDEKKPDILEITVEV